MIIVNPTQTISCTRNAYITSECWEPNNMVRHLRKSGIRDVSEQEKRGYGSDRGNIRICYKKPD